jgi:FixJ family two-component response regulator
MNDKADYRSHHIGERLIHIVDGDIETCEALSVLFRLEGFQTGYFQSAAQFVTALERWRPDAVVLNLRVGQDSGLALLSRVRGAQAGTPVVMLADGPQMEAAVTAMKLGAADVLTKPLDGDHLLMVVREALRREAGRAPAPPQHRTAAPRHFARLTPREREVLHLITHGQSNKEAGRQLGISPRTIEVHRARVMEKLGAKNTADLMRIVLTS